MASVLSYLRELNIVTMMLRILLAVLCGGLIGLERERKNRPAGFRTYMLTALGATLTVLLSLQLDQMLHGPWREVAESIGATQDVSRFGAEAAKGIGFLGAGTIIITARQQVKGLTTAAGLWAAAIIGLVCGAGYAECAIFATVVVLLVEAVLVRLEFRLTSKSTDLTLYIEYAHAVCMESVLALLRERSIRIDNLEISRISDSDAPDAPHHYCALIPIHSRTPLQPGDLRGDLTALPDMLAVEEM